MTAMLEREVERARRLFGHASRIEDVASVIGHDRPGDAAVLREALGGLLADARPLPPGVAARLLEVSDTTVRMWVRTGLLIAAPGTRRLDASRLHHVARLVQQLRREGRRQNLREALWRRLEDDTLVRRDDLVESLAQMRRGDLIRAVTFEEEQAGPAHR